jgi:hypothetical protein
MKRTCLLLSLTLIAGCAKAKPQLTPEQRAYVEVPEDEGGFREDENAMDITIPAFDPAHGAGSADQIGARFRGTDRKTPKITIAPAPRTKFTDVALLSASVAPDNAMLNHQPPIARDTMVRAPEEQRNVRVPAWIYAIKYEADQDWHVIIGTNPSGGTRTFFNAEVSGLPANAAAAFSTLKTVRQQLADILGDALPAGASYRKLTHPIPVVIEGSLFFDVDHPAGAVGPTGMRPDTAWEIHPVTKLTLQ